MNKDDAKDYLPLVQALADGKTIQYNDEGDWYDVDVLMTYACSPECYRIKPEPRTFVIWQHKISEEIESKSYIDYNPDIWERITVQEVLA